MTQAVSRCDTVLMTDEVMNSNSSHMNSADSTNEAHYNVTRYDGTNVQVLAGRAEVAGLQQKVIRCAEVYVVYLVSPIGT